MDKRGRHEGGWHSRLLEGLGHAVIVTDVAGTVTYWNRTAEELYGWTAQEAIGTNIQNLTVPQVSQTLANQIMDSLRSGGRWSGGFSVQRKDGSIFPALVTDTVVREENGDVAEIVGVSTHLGHALQPLLAHSADAALVLTEDVKVSYASPAATRIFGWTPPTPMGMPLPDLVHPDHREAVAAYCRRAAATTSALAPLDCRLLREDGSSSWAELLVTNMLADPAVRGLVANLRDTTERHEVEQRRSRQAAVTALVAQTATSVLAEEPLPHVYRRVVEGAARAFDATEAGLFVRDQQAGRFQLVAAHGPAAEQLSIAAISWDDPALAALMTTGQRVLEGPPPGAPDTVRQFLGPIALAGFTEPAAGEGLLGVGRPPGGDPFADADTELLATLVGQVALAIGLGRAHADQRRLAVLQERTRIARDLHDNVLQDLIAIGMQLQCKVDAETDPRRRESDQALVAQLEGSALRLRTAVVELREAVSGDDALQTIRAIVADAARVLGHLPTLTIRASAEDLAAPVGAQLAAVLREALSNVARHADATATDVSIATEDGRVTLRVDDDGRGPPEPLLPGGGLMSIEHRARALGGTAALVQRPGGGARLEWTCSSAADRRRTPGRSGGDRRLGG